MLSYDLVDLSPSLAEAVSPSARRAGASPW